MTSDRQALAPIANGLWTDGPPAHLIGGRKEGGEIIFPFSAETMDNIHPIDLSPTGTLWSWTSQEFEPKPPFSGPKPFEPFLLGYIELADQVIVESRIVETTIDALRLGIPMELVIVPFDEHRCTYAFRPENRA